MKVAELTSGMVLRVREGNTSAWLTNNERINHPSGDRELRFIMSHLVQMAPGISLPTDQLMVYLGSESAIINETYAQLVRRVYVDGYIAVVEGRNFRYLEPHPDFLDC